MMDDLSIPQAYDAEAATLGAMLLSRDAMSLAVELLRPEDFFLEAHRAIFEAETQIFGQGNPVDLVSVCEALRGRDLLNAVGGAGYLHRLTECTPYSTNVTHYAGIVKEKATLRRLQRAGLEMAERCQGDEGSEAILDSAEQSIISLSNGRSEAGFSSLKDLLPPVYEEAEKRFLAKSEVTGLPTGFIDLDRQTAGFQPADLIIIAGRPSMGKTSLAITIAHHVAQGGVPVAIFSLEMSKEQLVQGLICTEARINMQRWRTGRLTSGDWGQIGGAMDRLYTLPIHIDDTPGLSSLEMRSRSRRLHDHAAIGLIVVDYLQLMRGMQRYDSRVQEISEITRSLKSLARELKVPLVACCQLSRAVEQRQEKRPILSDLRESGQIEADADLVLALYRKSYYARDNGMEIPDSSGPDETEVLILKQRNGPTGMIKLGFLKPYKQFVSLERKK